MFDALGSMLPISAVVALNTAVQRPGAYLLGATKALPAAVTVTFTVALVPAGTVIVAGEMALMVPAGQSPSSAVTLMS